MRSSHSPRRHIAAFVRVSVVALLAGLLHVVTAAPASAAAPEGYVDYIASESPGYVTVAGWTRDPDNVGASLHVHFYVGDRLFVIVANQYRPDPTLQGYYGFSATVPIDSPGTYAWSATGMDSQGIENAQLIGGNGTITIADPAPSGAVESISSPSHRTVDLKGWASDPNAPASPVAIEAYIGGSFNTPGVEYRPLTANIARSDGKVGFSGQFTTTKTGAQDVYVYAINVPGSPGGNRLIGIARVTVYVDTTPPQTTITSAPKTATPQDVIRVTFTATEQNSTFECRWDEQPWFACQGGTQISLTPGNHMVSVRATDPYGNKDQTPATWVVAVSADATQPPPPPGSSGLTVAARTVNKKSRLRINIGPDSASSNYRVVIQRKVGKKWRKVARVRTRGDRDVVVVNLRRGKYRVVLPKSAQGPAVRSSAVRLKR